MARKGTLYWITGLSGAGKTAVGSRLYYTLREAQPNTVILDGHMLHAVLGKDLGFAMPDRLERAWRYSAFAKMLTDQGITVILCTIAMFDAVRDWNRANIDCYVEVFLDAAPEVLAARHGSGGYDRPQYPKTPDLTFLNNGDRSIKDIVEQILHHPVVAHPKNNDDVAYWNQWYAAHAPTDADPSLFAQAVLAQHIPQPQGKTLIEFGCGNGRDSLWFARQGLSVVGVDSSDTTIARLNALPLPDTCLFVCDDFVQAKALYQTLYDYCYSRFTLHAITARQGSDMLRNAYAMLKPGGTLFIEARSIRDAKFGQGRQVEHNAFILDNHYRRFIDPAELDAELRAIGFVVEQLDESDQFAPAAGEQCVAVRAIAKKGTA